MTEKQKIKQLINDFFKERPNNGGLEKIGSDAIGLDSGFSLGMLPQQFKESKPKISHFKVARLRTGSYSDSDQASSDF